MATKIIDNRKKTKVNSLDENLKHLRNLLSVDTIIDDINQEEALEFLTAVEENICKEREDHAEVLQEEKDREFTVDELIIKLKDCNIDDDKAKELLDIIGEDNPEVVYDFVKDKGYCYVKINSLVDEQKLRSFLEKEIYPRYADQVENIMM